MIPLYVVAVFGAPSRKDGVSLLVDQAYSFRGLQLLADKGCDLVIRHKRHSALFASFTNPNQPPVTTLFALVVIGAREMEVRIPSTIRLRQPKRFGTLRSTHRRFAWRFKDRCNWHSAASQNANFQKLTATRNQLQ